MNQYTEKFPFKYSPEIKRVIYTLTVFLILSISFLLLAYYESNTSTALFLHIVIGTFFSVATLLMAKVLYKTIKFCQQIIVNDTGISSPPSNTMGQNIMIKYSSIKRIFLHSVDSHMSIVILHNNERLIISETLLRDRNTFIALARCIDKKIKIENFSEG